MNRSTIESGLYTWLAALVSPTTVIFQDENGPRPTNYFTMHAHTFKPLYSVPHKTFPKTSTTKSLKSDSEFILSVIGYGSARDAVYTLRDNLEKPSSSTGLNAIGMSFVDLGTIIDATALRGSQFEAVAALDLTLRYGNVISYSVTPIEAIVASLNAVHIDGTETEHDLEISI